MACPTHRYADVVVATADGRIDFAGAQELESAIASALVADSGVRGLVIDFSKVDYISSVGLRVLMVAAKALRARRATVAVTALQSVVAEIFEISRFHHVVEVRHDVREAIAEISPEALAAYDRAREAEGR
ncbi:MAG: STAS domain-containing protein [Burkholderiales bacterium]|nr:STAS domain-containing protein [Burkholderiales bacterium]MCE7876239.1 anti-sigma factor antagonist [Betaproteobacteria bacterium PRO3]